MSKEVDSKARGLNLGGWPWHLFKTALGLVLLGWLVSSDRLDIPGLLGIWREISILHFILASLFFLVMQLLNAARLSLVLGIVGVHLPWWKVFMVVETAFAFNQMLPGNYGGDIIKGAWLSSRDASRKGMSAGVVIVDRLMGLWALSLLGAFAAWNLAWQSSPWQVHWNTLAILLSLVVLAFPLGVVLMAPFRRWEQAHSNWPLPSRGTLRNVARGVHDTCASRRRFPLGLVLALGTHLSALAGLASLAMALGGAMDSVWQQMQLSVLVMAVGIVPVSPGNLGWMEFIAGEVWAGMGLSLGAELFFLWRGISCMHLILGLCFLPFIQLKRPSS